MIDFLDVFNASLARLKNKAFIDRFYDIFIASDKRVADLFRETDLGRQKLMLSESLEEMKVFFCDHLQSPYLQSLARVHGRNARNIPDWMYDTWLKTMLQAVQETDPKFDATVGLAWRIVMAPGTEFMKHYGEA